MIVALFALVGGARAALAAPPPIVGTWHLSDGRTFALAADGNARGGGRTGMWAQDGRTFVITWFNPQPGMENEIEEVDRVAVAPNGTALSGKTDAGARIGGTRTAHAVAAQNAPRSVEAAAVAAARPSARVRRPPGSDGGMTAYNGLGRTNAAAEILGTTGETSATSATSVTSAPPGATTAASLASASTTSGSTPTASTRSSYAGAAAPGVPKAPGPPIVSPLLVSFTAMNQKVVMSVSLPGFTDYMGFCLAPGNCALGASSAPWSCNSQIAFTVPISFQGPGPVTIVMYGPTIPHVNMDCTFYVQAPLGFINYYTTKVLVSIRIP